MSASRCAACLVRASFPTSRSASVPRGERCNRGQPSAADGAALLATLMAMTLMTALATTLLLTTMTEALIAASYRDGVVARYLVEGAVERAMDAARSASDWRVV